MAENIKTFKDLIRLFWDNKGCDIIPLIGSNNAILGYYFKKNVTAHIADNTFLSRDICDANLNILTLPDNQNESEIFEKLGSTESFPVILSDGSFTIRNFSDFLTDYVPLEDNGFVGNESDEPEQISEEGNLSLISNQSQNFENQQNKGDKSLKESRTDIFTESNAKVKLFLEEYEFNESFDLVAYLESIEKRIIAKFLSYYEFNISKTAEALKIPRQTLQYKIKKFGLENKEE